MIDTPLYLGFSLVTLMNKMFLHRRVLSFISVLILIKLTFASAVSTDDKSGCSAPPLLPSKPFVIVWNHPTSLCEDHGIHLDFARWGIVDNTRDRFFGQQIVLFYYLGKFPYYNQQNQPINGGIPQLSDLKAHLSEVDNDLKTSVWNKTFGGLGIIDMEFWRPLYWTNFDSKAIYQRKSLDLAKQRFPHYNKSQVLAEAIKEFNSAARDFMGQTLLKTTTKRPNGKWGYYLFPRCFDPTCNTSTIRNNDRISWLFQNSSGLYPSIYFKLATSRSARALKIKQTLHEAFRVKAKYSSQDIPIMPYSKSQEGPYKMYQTMELSEAILQPANMGSSGVVIWGSSSDARAKNECLILQDYINKVLGPYSLNVSNFFGNCTEQLCHGHGRCVRKDYERIYQKHLHESDRNECLISDKMLEDSHKVQDVDYQLPVNFDHNKETKRNGYNEVSQGENKALSFLDYVKKSINFDLKWGKKNSVVIKSGEALMKSSQSVINFSMKSNRGNVEDAMNASFSSQEALKSDTVPNFDTGAPNYDFDDYVCKCFPGYTGDHCQNNNV